MKKITLLIVALLFSIAGFSQFPTPGSEGFEGTTGPDLAAPTTPSPWTLGTGATTNQWAVFDNGVGLTRRWGINSVVANVYQGTNSAYMDRENIGVGNTSEDYLATPLVTVPSNGQLRFWTRSTISGPNGTEYFIKVFDVTAQGAGSQTNIANYINTPAQWTEATLSATYNVYEEKVVDLTAFANHQVYIAFVMRYNQPTGALGGDRWLVDDVRLAQRCLEPTNLSATGITQNSANLSWSNPSGSTSWEIEVTNTTPTGVGVVYNGALPYVATGLQPGTGYVYYVRSLCADGSSNWVGPFNFATTTPGLSCIAPITISALPYSTNDNTTNYGDTTDTNQGTSCGSTTNFMTGNDVFYSYTPTTTGAISITMTPGANSSSIFVYQGCANVGATCLAGVANTTNTVRSIPSLNVIAGQQYIIVLSGTTAAQTYSYSLVIQQLNCAQPTNQAVTGISLTGGNLSWANPGNATSWEYVVQTSGSAIPAGAGTQTSSNTTNPITGLNPDTAYQYWVRADCGNGTFSAWAGPFVFNTLVPPPACGGTFTDQGGASANYANNLDSTVVICPTTPGEVVTVTFTSFNTQASNDGLYIFNGNSISAPQFLSGNPAGTVPGGVAGSYWGTTNPGAFTSSSADGCLTFRFRSNGTTNAAGWVANVTCALPPACPAPFSITSNTVLSSSANIAWTAAGPATQWHVIALPCTAPAPTASSTGWVIANTNPFTLTGLTGETCYNVYVRSACSSSDFSTWSGPTTFTTSITPPACGGTFTDPGGSAANYANGADTTVTICPTVPGEVVTVTFTTFNTEATYDGLYVFNGNAITSPQISSTNGAGNVPGALPGSYWGNLTGANLPGSFTSTAPNGCLTFRFRSDGSVNNPGWVANVSCAVPPTCPNPNTLTTSAVTSNSATLAWVNPNTATTWHVLALPCGSPAPNASTTTFITTTTNPHVFTGLTPDTCYNLYVRAVCPGNDLSNWVGPSTITTQIAPPACGGTFTDPAGATVNYANGSDYTVTICPTIPTEQVTVTFTSFNTEATWDGLYVFDGNSIAAPQLASTNGGGNVPGGLPGSYWGTLTGANLPGPFTASSANGCLTFRFRSDGSVNAPGWVANVTCAPPPTCPKPTAVAISAITQTGATISWTEIGSATTWEVLIVPAGSPVPNASSAGIITTTNPYIATGLSSGTQYDVYVRSRCSNTDISLWSNVRSFTTLIANDECANATVAPVNTTNTCLQTVSGTVIGATASTQPNACGGTDDDDVWFQFTATSTSHTINLNNVTGSTTDLYHVLYSGSCGTLTQLYCSDPNNSNANGLVPGQTYFIRVYTWTGTPNQTSAFTLCIGTPVPPPSCITNTPAGNTCAVATPICNLNGYCGNTSASYTSDSWPQLTTEFCGSLENNSFLTFVASSSTISLDVWVTSSQDNLGIQIMIFGAATCGSGPVTEYLCWSPGNVPAGATNLSATGLTPGQTYYVMIDGFAGDVCNYVIGANTGIQTPVAINTSTTTTSPTICLGQTATLNATGGNGIYTWSPSTQLNTTTGSSVIFSPTAVGTYNITATSSDNNPLCPQSASSTQTIIVVDYVNATFNQIQPFCEGTTPPVLPTTANSGVTGTWSPSVVSNTVGTTTYTFTPNITQCSFPTTMDIVVTPNVVPSFLAPAPICPGSPAPVLPTSSSNATPITGTWSPSVVSNTASGTYTFTPDPGQCAATTTLNVTVLPNCDFGSYANAVWLTNCETSGFFNTVGSGTDIIGPATNVFPNTDLGTYVQNSNTLIFRGGELKTFKSATANVCSARLNYRIYPAASTPGAFTVFDLPFFDNCGGGTFPSGGPCSTGDQKWQRVLNDSQSPINLTNYPPGNYVIEVYYDVTGDVNSTSACDDTIFINNNGANYIATFTIQSNPVYAGTNPTTCAGTNGTITISGLASNESYALTYQDDTTTVGPNTITTNSAGVYVITGLNSGNYSNFLLTVNGCSLPNTTSIVLIDPSSPTVTVNSPTVCDGTSATVTATPNVSGSYNYVWTVPAGVTNPGNVATFTTTIAGTYSVIITSTTTGCSSSSASGVVTVISNPIVTVNSPTVCSGALATITAAPGTTGTYSYSWTVPSGVANPGNVATFDTNVSGTYSVIITDTVTGCSSSSASGIVTINTNPTVSVNSPVACEGSTVTLVATAGSAGTYSYAWTVPSGVVNPGDVSTFTTTVSGTYSVVITNSATGCISTSAAGIVTINPNPIVSVNNTSVCSGALATVTATPNVAGSYNYVWTVPAGGTDPGNVASFTTLLIGTYSVIITDTITGCSSASASGVVAANPNPTVSVNSPTVCSGALATLIASAGSTGSYSYVWTVPSGVTNPGDVATFDTSIAGTYSVVITDTATGCSSASASGIVTVNTNPTVSVNSPVACDGSTVTLVATAGSAGTYNYAWTVPSGVVNPGDVSTFTTTVSGTYSVVITDATTGCFSTSASGVVTINANPIVTVNSPSVCSGTLATVTATPNVTASYNYVWTVPTGVSDPGNVDSFTTSVAGTYSVVITNSSTGCVSSSASGTVTVNSIPTVSVSSATVCQGTTASIAATPGTAGTYSYVWTVPTGATNPGNVATINTTVAGTYSVIITNTVTGCTSSSASGTVTINANPTVTVTDLTICQGGSATVVATPGTAGTYSYVWTVPASVTNPGNVASFTTSVSGQYSVVITNTATGCTGTDSGTVTFTPAFDFVIDGGCENNSFVLEVIPTNNSFDINTASFAWQFGSTSVGTGDATFDVTAYVNSTSVIEPLPLTFNVTVTTAAGCILQKPITLPAIYCTIQKGISPNNDGSNEYFDLEYLGVQKLSIYNRYGSKVYSKADYTNEWIGQSDNGNELPDGTYYYVIEFKNNQASKSGWIYINRENK
ncbi:fibronectin type III domain-containing protein [Flavobacterium sp.]|uniref:fibronectin type III domain-containing protein n=1 Tax=Flavobacterium sp. TaxID=239 RepID=UPI00261EB6A2|nr:fibronectin type III domain-containing protein [Flavobacterium sp.]